MLLHVIPTPGARALNDGPAAVRAIDDLYAAVASTLRRRVSEVREPAQIAHRHSSSLPERSEYEPRRGAGTKGVLRASPRGSDR